MITMHDFLRLVLSFLKESIEIAIIAGVLFGIVLGITYFVFRVRKGKKEKFPWGKAIPFWLLAGYGVVLFYVTLLRYGGMYSYSSANLHLFRAWREAWNYCSLQNWLNVLLNVALFIPLGLLLPLLVKWIQKWYVMLAVGFGTSLIIEGMQLCLGRGVFDVDDLFTNTLGGMFGFCIVMALRRLICKKERSIKKFFAYMAYPLIFVAVLISLSISYSLKEYGNLQEAPAFTVNTKGIEWELQCGLDDSVQSAAIYQASTLDKDSSDVFAAAFAENAGITFPDASYYDHSTIFANHSTGDFLRVSYLDGSYRYSVGNPSLEMNVWDLEDAEVDEETLRAMLAPYNIFLPDTTEFHYDGNGRHIFTVDMVPTRDGVIDGTLQCRCKEGMVLTEIENNLLSLKYYKEEAIITQTEGYERLCSGKFGEGAFFEYYKPDQVIVRSCKLDYRVDTKGFYQPVYVFEISLNDEDFEEIVVPAMK